MLKRTSEKAIFNEETAATEKANLSRNVPFFERKEEVDEQERPKDDHGSIVHRKP